MKNIKDKILSIFKRKKQNKKVVDIDIQKIKSLPRYKTLKILRKINTVVTILIILSNIYIIASPIQPEISYLIDTKITKKEQKDAYTQIKESQEQGISHNLLIIPKIGVNGQIYEGNEESVLNKGFWRIPSTSTPDKGGNTVITAHRYLYKSGPNTFYLLDKISVGDQIAVFWNGLGYYYEVSEVFEVMPNQTEIQDNTDESILTLYTCTPLYTANKRLVVKAKLISNNQ